MNCLRHINNSTKRLILVVYSKNDAIRSEIRSVLQQPVSGFTSRRSFTQYWLDTKPPKTSSSSPEKLFNKILIANRGEIARRIIKTCRQLGIKTVAVHSDVDACALFVREADEAICIGPAPTSQSYLNMDRVLDACMQSKAEAVHPGYGFLSENMQFAARLEQAGITFIGPNSHAVNEMGDKIHSKQVAHRAKVSTIPGYDGEMKDAEQCVKLSNEIGYPVMVKASAGGGGKGMRVCYNDKDVQQAFRLCAAEAKSSFGDDRLLVEKYIEEPHHVEVQVLGDKHGNAIYLNERECSVQRRNQKVIEEAPSPFVDPELRRRMGEQAVAMARAVGYDSAGTVEFLVDKHKQFYFLEMNTRLQVEHPITECITGVDLVYHMIRSAAGHALAFQQNDIGIDGWALEARVYAEDPYKSFGLPSIGRLSRYMEPTNDVSKLGERPSDGFVRCDSGIVEGSEISVYYDPLICKLITAGRDREHALRLMRTALDEYVIRGVTHNIPLLRDIVSEEQFCAGNVTTAYLPQTYPDGFKGVQLSDEEKRLTHVTAACMHLLHHSGGQSDIDKTDADNDFTVYNVSTASGDSTAKDEGKRQAFRMRISTTTEPSSNKHRTRFTVQILPLDISGPGEHIKKKILMQSNSNFDASSDPSIQSMNVSVEVDPHKPVVKIIHEQDDDNEPIIMQLLQRKSTGQIKLQYKGSPFSFQIYPTRFAHYIGWMPEERKEDLSKVVVAPMPGVVKAITVKVGDSVSEGMEVCVIEAMKMQNSLTAPAAGKVKAVNAKVGETVDEAAQLIVFE